MAKESGSSKQQAAPALQAEERSIGDGLQVLCTRLRQDDVDGITDGHSRQKTTATY